MAAGPGGGDAPHVDHVLCLLPFEPAELKRLGGPPGTFVGHRLTHDPGMLAAAAAQAAHATCPSGDAVKTLLLLPGSRKGEVQPADRAVRRDVSTSCAARGHRLRLLLPTVPHVAALVEAAVVRLAGSGPRSSLDAAGKWQAFGEADAALGRVRNRLAGTGAGRRAAGLLLQARSGSPNACSVLITIVVGLAAQSDRRPAGRHRILQRVCRGRAMLARHARRRCLPTRRCRRWQKDGFAEVTRRMATDRPSGEIAAEVVLRQIAESE